MVFQYQIKFIENPLAQNLQEEDDRQDTKRIEQFARSLRLKVKNFEGIISEAQAFRAQQVIYKAMQGKEDEGDTNIMA